MAAGLLLEVGKQRERALAPPPSTPSQRGIDETRRVPPTYPGTSLAAPSLAADASSPYPCRDKTIDVHAGKTTGLGRLGSPWARTGAPNASLPSMEPATRTQRLETGVAGLGVIALAVVLWL